MMTDLTKPDKSRQLSQEQMNAVEPIENSAFKCEQANRILDGVEHYSLKQWREDLRKELDCEGEDEKTREAHFMVCAGILYIGVCLIDYPKVKDAFLNIYPEFNKDKEGKKLASNLIRDTRREYKDFEELLIAIIMRKYIEFIKRGLSKGTALGATDRWLREEIGV
jgi:hypothetical protein